MLVPGQKPVSTKVDRQCAGLCSLGMKINAKLGGINVRLAGSQQEAMPHIGRKPVMFLGKPLLSARPGAHMMRLLSKKYWAASKRHWCNAGADVTHPVTFAETEPSIASVVGSLVRMLDDSSQPPLHRV